MCKVQYFKHQWIVHPLHRLQGYYIHRGTAKRSNSIRTTISGNPFPGPNYPQTLWKFMFESCFPGLMVPEFQANSIKIWPKIPTVLTIEKTNVRRALTYLVLQTHRVAARWCSQKSFQRNDGLDLVTTNNKIWDSVNILFIYQCWWFQSPCALVKPNFTEKTPIAYHCIPMEPPWIEWSWIPPLRWAASLKFWSGWWEIEQTCFWVTTW